MAMLGRNSSEKSQDSSDLAVPWEEKLPPEKRRYDVRFIRGGPGKSGMGIVYLAYDREFKEPYAIKTFQDRFLGSPQAVENFKKEAQVWVELGKHKNIIKAVNVQVFLGRPYIFLEMVAGDELYGADLSGWIRGKGLDLPLMLNFVIQFCRGMSHAEKRFKEMGRVFVHRDIKPENIMVTRDKVVKITDFGLVHAVRDEVFDPERIGDEAHGRFSVVSQHGICGTPFYMSPEQVLQGADWLKQLGIVNTTPEVPPPDLRSDMYAFGCVLYAMIRGNPPFRKFPFNRRDYPRYFSQTLYEEPVSVASGDREFDELIMRLLRKAPEKREYRSFAELEEALQGIYARLTGERLKEERIEEIEAWELLNRGLSFDHLGQSERAIEDYDKAIELNPGLAMAYNNRGNAYYALGQSERAIADYDKAITLNPGDAAAYTNRGTAYAALGQYERAIEDYSRFIELAPPQYAQHIAAVKEAIRQLEAQIRRR